MNGFIFYSIFSCVIVVCSGPFFYCIFSVLYSLKSCLSICKHKHKRFFHRFFSIDAARLWYLLRSKCEFSTLYANKRATSIALNEFSCWNGFCFSSNLYIYFILYLILVFFLLFIRCFNAGTGIIRFYYSFVRIVCLAGALVSSCVMGAMAPKRRNNKVLLSHCFCITVFMLWEREKWTSCYVFTHYVQFSTDPCVPNMSQCIVRCLNMHGNHRSIYTK